MIVVDRRPSWLRALALLALMLGACGSVEEIDATITVDAGGADVVQNDAGAAADVLPESHPDAAAGDVTPEVGPDVDAGGPKPDAAIEFQQCDRHPGAVTPCGTSRGALPCYRCSDQMGSFPTAESGVCLQGDGVCVPSCGGACN